MMMDKVIELVEKCAELRRYQPLNRASVKADRQQIKIYIPEIKQTARVRSDVKVLLKVIYQWHSH
jgi:hypothetical protein